MIERTICLVTSLHLVHAKMVKTCPKKIQEFFLYIQQEPVSHLLMKEKFHTIFFLNLQLVEIYTFYHLYTFRFKKAYAFFQLYYIIWNISYKKAFF